MKSCLGLGPVWVTKKEHVPGFVYMHALAYQLRSVMSLMLGEAHTDMSVDESLWELERLNAVEFVVGGNGIAVMRRLTAVDGVVNTLAQVSHLHRMRVIRVSRQVCGNRVFKLPNSRLGVSR